MMSGEDSVDPQLLKDFYNSGGTSIKEESEKNKKSNKKSNFFGFNEGGQYLIMMKIKLTMMKIVFPHVDSWRVRCDKRRRKSWCRYVKRTQCSVGATNEPTLMEGTMIHL